MATRAEVFNRIGYLHAQRIGIEETKISPRANKTLGGKYNVWKS